GNKRGDILRRRWMSRITLRVRLLRSSHWPISSLDSQHPYYLDSLTFSLSVGVREFMNHFVVKTLSRLVAALLR
ncbi:MAG: hypothetical protein ACXWXZ_05910, partial [Candidatus Binatia bacterium]